MKAHLASFSLLAAVLAAAPARAATFYVATTGNDAYPGSVDLPFRTVGKGVSALRAAGDTLYLRAGTYTSAIYPAVSGTAAAWITIAAYPGELPIIDGAGASVGGSGVEPTSVAVQYVRVVGLASRNWPSSGFSNGFNFPSSHIEFRDCIADGNGINGIAFYKATGVLIQNNIVAHNGNQLPSFSSGVNLFTAGGTFQDNVVRGNVSFENVDISGAHSDGSGFILDQNSTGALFDGNIAFGNGGSCIRLTSSSGSHIVNNTCYHNGVDPANAFTVHEIFFSDNPSRTNVLASNNLTAAIAGRMGFSQTAGTGSTFRNNLQINNNGATPFFMNPAGVDFRPVAGSTTVIDQGNTGDAGPNDIGFDPRCIRQQGGQAVARWQYVVDYTYVASVGGVAGCFRPGPRIQGAAPDLGAYEAGNPIGTGAGGAAGGMGGAGGSGGVGGMSGGGGGAGGSAGGTGGRGGAGGTSSGAGGSSGGAGGNGAGGTGTATGAGGASSGSGGTSTGDTGGAPAGERGAAAGCGCATAAPVRQDSFGLLGAIVLGVGLLLGTRSRAGRAASDRRRPSPAGRTPLALLVAGALAASGAAFSACIIHPGATTVAGAPVPASEVAPLRQAAAAAQRHVGVALMSHRLDDQRVRALVAAHFDSLTPENEMKWGAIEPQRGHFSFTAGDKLVAFAAERGMRVRGHTLVWHEQLAPWVKGLTGPALQAAVASHVQGVVGHFKGKVAAWDVVNEAFANGPSGELRAESPFSALGPSFIDEAFRLAHQADPAAQLFYNDYEIEGEGTPKAEAVFQLCQRLKETGVPIDGVGMQMHVDPRHWPPADSIRRNMERFAALGLRVEITEMDVPVGEIPGTVAEKLAQQRIIAHDIVAACIAVPHCAGVTFWGLTDRDSWLTSTEWGALRGRLPHYPLLFDGDYRPKPIVVGVLDAFSGR